MVNPTADAHPSTAQPYQGSRSFGLDIMRAVAILSVVYLHGYYFFPSDVYFAFAIDGVSVFFVLSGYLIGRIVIDVFVEQSANWSVLRRFWIRRWLRTLPNYYLVLVFLLLLSVLSGKAFPPEAPLYFLFSQNLFQIHPAFFPEAWSLSLEEWFYLVFPLAAFLLLRHLRPDLRRRYFLFMICVAILGFTAVRTLVAASNDIGSFQQWDELLRKRVLTYSDAIAIGVFAVYGQRYAPFLWRLAPRRMLAAGLAILVIDRVLFMQGGFYVKYLSLSVVPLATALLLPLLSSLRGNSSIGARVIYFFSRISYSMYLVHFSLVMLTLLPSLPFAAGRGPYVAYLCYWLLTIGIATLLNRYWEIPFMNLRDRVFTANRQKSATASDVTH
ncbi:hypothetical protein C3941_03845 [Kaistia algarum]|uniref:acyltransferase family protein n=1 Tax=Kaistia algarum TaxID=2083279 RepID=UPI000CE939DD|nr:acyltransferase [Kaistia algarum]MCX5512653.1 acyltransferase [Kaistia algarum]PPE81835.1 hypothetical protein C3941_03845 [Kaistia algarum]